MLVTHAAVVYTLAYFGVVIVAALLEWGWPLRPMGEMLRLRWSGNLSLAVVNLLVTRAIFPLAGITIAFWCASRGIGVFNRWSITPVVAVPAAVLALDFVHFLQHGMLHRSDLLWRIHRTHHTDLDYDFSTGLRFHPLEALYTTTVMAMAIAALGAPPAAVLLSDVLGLVFTLFEHTNVRVPERWERVLRINLVTPSIHSIHHSSDARDSRSNYGTVFTWWDRLCGTYRSEPSNASDAPTFGVNGFLNRKHLTLPWMLIQPLLSESGSGWTAADPGDQAKPGQKEYSNPMRGVTLSRTP